MKNFCILLGLVFALFTANIAHAQTDSTLPLSSKEAFKLTVEVAPQQVILAKFQIAPGYYLHKNRFEFSVLSPKNAKSNIQYPQAISSKMPDGSMEEIYKNTATIPITVLSTNGLPLKNPVKLLVRYQGCSESGVCYPPIHMTTQIDLNKITVASHEPPVKPITSEQDKVMQLLMTKSLGFILLGFLGFGLLLAFTPCVLPMLPILSAIIVGQDKEMSMLKAFKLSLVYILGMAINYALIGVLAGLLGSHFQAFFQAPAFLITFSLLFVILAFSLFGCYELQLPHGLHQRIMKWSNRHEGGTYVGVGVMGFISTLIVSPCVTAPLVGALSYIGRTGDAMLGGTALFVMGIGMGIPLMIFGTSEGKLLPKAGPWMKDVKSFFGILMLAVSIDLLQRILPDGISITLWAILAIWLGVYLIWFSGISHHVRIKIWRFLGIIPIIYGLLLFVNLSFGIHSLLQPFAFIGTSQAIEAPATFKTIHSMQELSTELNLAKKAGKWTLLDFSARWCIACQELERTTFSTKKVKDKLSHLVLLRVDLTDTTPENTAIQDKLNVIAPPTVLFFTPQGKEQKNLRVVGEISPDDFMDRLKGLS
jgi:thiol:disulfide interchange protein DsbD